MTYAGVQLYIRTMDFIINCPPAYVICTIYSIPFFPYFAKLNYAKRPNLDINISKSTYHIYLIFLGNDYLDAKLQFCSKI